MTTKELWIFKGILGLGFLMMLMIVSLVVFGVFYQTEAEDRLPVVASQPTEPPVVLLSISEEEQLLLAFRQKVAPVEVGPAHRAVEQHLIEAFEEDQKLSYDAFESFLRPLLTSYFSQWYKEMAISVFNERQLETDEDLMEIMLSSVSTEDKVDFMLLYEKVFLKSRGIVIEDIK